MAGTTPYLGSKISLISRLDIRYEGTLYSVDPVDSTIALSQVRPFGTEDRPSIVPVPARAEVYEFIIFKASDIKDLIVCEVAKPTPAVDDIHYDPAIVSVSRPPPPVQQPPPQQQDSQASSPQGQVPAQFPHPVNIPPPQPRPPQRQSAAESTGRFSNRPQQQRSYYSRAVQQPAQQQNQQRQYYPRQQQQQVSDGQGQQNRRAPYVQQNRAPPVYHRAPAQRGGERPKFEGDFDFEKANEQLAEMNLNEDEKSSNQSVPESEEQADDRKVSDKGVMDAAGENFYDRTTSFFDNISCDALEREEGKSCRVDWKKERVTNQETFGTTAVNRNYGRGGGRAYRGGGYNYGQQNYYRNNQRYNNNNPRQHQPAQQQRQQMHY